MVQFLEFMNSEIGFWIIIGVMLLFLIWYLVELIKKE